MLCLGAFFWRLSGQGCILITGFVWRRTDPWNVLAVCWSIPCTLLHSLCHTWYRVSFCPRANGLLEGNRVVLWSLPPYVSCKPHSIRLVNRPCRAGGECRYKNVKRSAPVEPTPNAFPFCGISVLWEAFSCHTCSTLHGLSKSF